MDQISITNSLVSVNELIEFHDANFAMKSDVLAQITCLLEQFLTQQKTQLLCAADRQLIQKCHANLLTVSVNLKKNTKVAEEKKATQLAIEKLNPFINKKLFLNNESRKLLAITSSLVPLSLEEHDSQMALEYCRQILKLYAPELQTKKGDLFQITLNALSKYMSFSSQENKNLAQFHLLCLKIYNHHLYIDNLYSTYEELEVLVKDPVITAYAKIKQAELISIDLTYTSKDKNIKLLTEKQVEILNSIDPATIDSDTDARRNYLLGTSFMHTEWLALRDASLAEKAFKNILETSKNSYYLSQTHYKLGILFLFGYGPHARIDTKQALEHFKEVLPLNCTDNVFSKNAAKFINLMNSGFQHVAYEIESKGQDYEPRSKLVDYLNAYVEGKPLEMAYCYANSSFFVKLDGASTLGHTQKKELPDLFKLHKFESNKTNSGPTNYLSSLMNYLTSDTKHHDSSNMSEYINCASEVLDTFRIHYCREYANEMQRWMKKAACIEQKSPNQREKSQISTSEHGKNNLRPLFSMIGVEMLNNGYASSKVKGHISKLDLVHSMTADYIEQTKALEFPLKGHFELYRLFQIMMQYEIRNINPDAVLPQDQRRYQLSTVRSVNYSKIMLENGNKFAICPSKETNQMYMKYTDMLFIPDELTSPLHVELAKLAFEVHRKEKDFFHINELSGTILLVMRSFEIAISHAENFEQKLEIIGQLVEMCHIDDIINISRIVIPSDNCTNSPIVLKTAVTIIEYLKYKNRNEMAEELFNFVKLNEAAYNLFKREPVYIKNRVKCYINNQKDFMLSLLPNNPAFTGETSFVGQAKMSATPKNITSLKGSTSLPAQNAKLQPIATRVNVTAQNEQKQPAKREKISAAPLPLSSAAPQIDVAWETSPQSNTTQESKKVALEALEREEKKLQLKKMKTPSTTTRTPNLSFPDGHLPLLTDDQPNQPTIHISPQAWEVFEKIFSPQDSELDLSTTHWDACDFRVDTKIKNAEVAMLIKELGGEYHPAAGKGSHAKCTLYHLNNSNAFTLKGEKTYFANFDLFEPASSIENKPNSEMIVLTNNEYLKPYQIRQLCEKLIAQGFTPQLVKSKASL